MKHDHLKRFSWLLCLGMFLELKQVSCENIVVVHHMSSYSHRVATRPLAEALAARGHKVSYIAPMYPKQLNPNITEYVAKEHAEFIQAFINADFEVNLRVNRNLEKMVNILFDLAVTGCEILYKSPEFKAFLQKNPKVDLLILDNCFSECGIGIAQKTGAKYMVFGTVAHLAYEYDAFGYLPQSSVVPELEVFPPTPPMSFLDRISNTFMSLRWRWEHYKYNAKIDNLIKDVLKVPQTPPMEELIRNVSLYLTTSEVITDYPRTLPPMYINVAGIHCKSSENSLPPEIEEFITRDVPGRTNDGFVYISLGTLVVSSDLPNPIKQVFFEMIKSFPNLKFLWKWNGDFPTEIPDNLYLSKWFPQVDVLGHSKIRAFVTQSGRPSTLEAIYNGVPMISFPIIGDQDINADRMRQMGATVKLEIGSVTFQEFKDAIQKMVYDPNSKKRLKRLQKIFLDRPMGPVDTAVWWTEYVLRHEDTAHLRPAGNDQYWFVRRQIDVWGTLSVGAFISFVCLYKIIMKILQSLRGKTKLKRA